jgi:Uma2 family endonuclease
MLAGATLVSVEEYLRTDYKPACDYIDGVLRQKSMATHRHGRVQGRIVVLISRFAQEFEAIPELTCWIRPEKYLVPDLGIQLIDEAEDPYPTRPVHLCVEVLSPGDRFSETVAKCDEFHTWGVPYCWIIDPDNRQCWEYHLGSRPSLIPSHGHITAGTIMLSHADIFASLPD